MRHYHRGNATCLRNGIIEITRNDINIEYLEHDVMKLVVFQASYNVVVLLHV